MVPAPIPSKWDHVSDVVIIGGGTGGLPAGIVVSEAKQKATILEWRPQCGGSLGMVVGAFAIAGSDEQKAQGIKDSPDIYYNDLIRVCKSDPEIARAFADNQIKSYNILKKFGMKWPGIVPLPGHSQTRGLGWLLGWGPKIVKAYETGARASGAEILNHHRATRLVKDDKTGRIVGVVATDDKGATKYFKATRGVIITTGGFGQNREMVQEYAPHMVNSVPKMPIGHQGDGLKMALDVGAATRDISVAVAGSWPVDAETHSRCIWALDWGGIMVNVDGNRFHMESSEEGYYGKMTGAAMKQPGGVYWVVFDEKIMGNIGRIEGTNERNPMHIKDIERCKRMKANTIDELVKMSGVNAAGFKAAIEKYNGDIDKVGYDTVYGRKYQMGMARPIEKINPPYYAVKCVTCTTSMKGGLKINGKCQVINNYGEAIPGLYAGGEVAGGLWTTSYMLAVMTSGAATQGIIAAENAIKEPAVK
jgi:flavocytochrome c